MATEEIQQPAVESATAAAPATAEAPPTPPPLRSVHTDSFPAILRHYGISIFVSTYQAGKLVILRAEGDRLNTHFHEFPKPMGVAFDRQRNSDRLAVGTAAQIWEFHNLPAVRDKLQPPGLCDRVYLPRSSHVTGDVLIHEMAWGDNELWFVNTKFSCLCTREPEFSFAPRWQPSFISGIAPEDRCHLNGLGMNGSRPSVVSALGVADTPGGWRAHKRDGGVLIDLADSYVLPDAALQRVPPRLRSRPRP